MEKPECLLTQDEAMNFISRNLEVKYGPYNHEHNRDKLLQDLTRRWMQKIPFTTIKQLSLPAPRTCPTYREALDDVMSGMGGLCATHAVAMWHVLTALDYNCEFALARFHDHTDHVCILVRDVSNVGDLHLVDVGSGYPAFEPIKIKDAKTGFVRKTDVKEEATSKYKYVRVDEGGRSWTSWLTNSSLRNCLPLGSKVYLLTTH